MINYITLAMALILSAIAAYFSVVGIATIFSGAFIAVIVMAGALEAAKVVTVSWLSRNWSNCPKIIKWYLIPSVVILMLITSMGTFGYLSKAHLETQAQMQQSQLLIQPLETQYELATQKLNNAQRSLDALDDIIDGVDVNRASGIRARQRVERETLVTEISNASGEIQRINAELLPFRTQQAQTEAEIGPLKYVAELIYGEEAESHFDSAVRFIIILLVIVFDPLAIVLLIAANYGMKPQSRLRFNKATGQLESTF